MPRAIISPSVLASDFGQLTAECKRMIKDGAEWLHMDIMDGHFVPNITMGAPILTCVHKSIPDIFMDCHMMVAQPEKEGPPPHTFLPASLSHLFIQWVDDIAAAGGALYCFHLEATSDALQLISRIKDKGMRAGVAISPDTPSQAITDEIGKAADMLLVMTVYPGRGGQKFLERCVPKVAQLRDRFPDQNIEVDGGVSPATIGACADAGSNVIVAGTAIFGTKDSAQAIAHLKSTVEAAQAKIASK